MTDGAALPAPAVLADARQLPPPDASVDRVTRAGFPDADVSLGEWMHAGFVPSSHAGAVYTRLVRHRLTRPLAVANIWVHAVRP